MTEERRPEWPCEKRNRKRRQRGERGRGRVRSGKEQLGKYKYGGGRVDVEVEELDGGANETGKQDLARPVHSRAGAVLENRDVDVSSLAHWLPSAASCNAY